MTYGRSFQFDTNCLIVIINGATFMILLSSKHCNRKALLITKQQSKYLHWKCQLYSSEAQNWYDYCLLRTPGTQMVWIQWDNDGNAMLTPRNGYQYLQVCVGAEHINYWYQVSTNHTHAVENIVIRRLARPTRPFSCDQQGQDLSPYPLYPGVLIIPLITATKGCHRR